MNEKYVIFWEESCISTRSVNFHCILVTVEWTLKRLHGEGSGSRIMPRSGRYAVPPYPKLWMTGHVCLRLHRNSTFVSKHMQIFNVHHFSRYYEGRIYKLLHRSKPNVLAKFRQHSSDFRVICSQRFMFFHRTIRRLPSQ